MKKIQDKHAPPPSPAISNWARMDGFFGDASFLLDAGGDSEFNLLVLFVELATKKKCGRFKDQFVRNTNDDWYKGIRYMEKHPPP